MGTFLFSRDRPSRKREAELGLDSREDARSEECAALKQKSGIENG